MKRLLITLILLCGALTVSARDITGVVRSGGKGLEGVLVTDGTNFAVTDAKGAFRLNTASGAEFVYITTPSGYSAPVVDGVVQFYRRLDQVGKKDRVVFELDRLTSGDDFVLLTVADPQTGNQRHFDRFQKETEPDLAALIEDYRAGGFTPLALYLGDIAWDQLQFFAEYRKHVERLGVPVYQTIGNHDYDMNLVGDEAASREFRSNFGPLYYGFNVGGNYFIVTDNIIYDTNKKFEEEWDEQQVAWLAKYAKLIPAGSDVYIAMHAPYMKYFQKKGSNKMETGQRVADMFAAHNLSFITGHTHINSNMEVEPGVMEFNVASAGGAWWRSGTSKDGTPNGYKVFEFSGPETKWYYKSTGKPADYQMRVYDRGNFVDVPNAVVAKVWDWDDEWIVEWYQDGVGMGNMERFFSVDPDYCRSLAAEIDKETAKGNTDYKIGGYRFPTKAHFFFAAVPDRYAREVEIVVTDRFGRVFRESLKLASVDVQAHRGGMGLMPENTVEAMIEAVKLGVNTLELDLQISKDGKVVVSHDPYMNYKFVTTPDGTFIEKGKTKNYRLYNMAYDSIVKYDTGSKPHPDYPQQKNIVTRKPLVSDLIDAVEKFTAENGYTPMNYNIEIKSSESNEKSGMSPGYRDFTDLAMDVLLSKGLGDRLIVQCFDVRTLRYLHDRYPEVTLAYLVDAKAADFDAAMAELDFIPEWYSPHFSLISEESLIMIREKGMKVVPWTVDDLEDIRRIVNLGVDAIISNYPDRVLKITRKY